MRLIHIVVGSVWVLSLMGCAQTPLLTTTFPDASQKVGTCTANAIPNEYVIHWKSGIVTKSSGMGRTDLIQNVVYPQLNDIHFVEPNYRIQIKGFNTRSIQASAQSAVATVPDQSVLNWNVKQTSATQAWSAGANGQGVTVAIIDSGVDTTHPQLQGQIFVNAAEANGKAGVDDDNNGYVDDINGWNFTTNSATQNDQIGHGTHVAGTVAALHVNATSPMGFAPQAKILPLQFISTEDAGGTTYDAIRAIQYATAMGVQVMNASWGSNSCSQTLQSVVGALDQKNILFIAAAGNSSNDLNSAPEYPAAFQGAHQLTVAATTEEFLRAGFSNFGSLVQLGAPGMDIVSLYKGDAYAVMDGTSMATPAVTGEAAAIWSSRPNATASQVKAAILAGVDSGITGVSTGGQMNVQKALAYLQQTVSQNK